MELPPDLKRQLSEIHDSYQEKELTEKGYRIQKGKLLKHLANKNIYYCLESGKTFLPEVIALIDYVPTSLNELSFKKNDILTLLEKISESEYKCERKGVVGVVKANVVKFPVSPPWELPNGLLESFPKAKKSKKSKDKEKDKELEFEINPSYRLPPSYGDLKTKRDKDNRSSGSTESLSKKSIDANSNNTSVTSHEKKKRHSEVIPREKALDLNSVSSLTKKDDSNLPKLNDLLTTDPPFLEIKYSDSSSRKSENSPPSSPIDNPRTKKKSDDFGKPADESEEQVFISGFLEKKNDRLAGYRKAKQRSWKTYWVSLVGSSFYFYLSEQPAQLKKREKPLGIISILDASITHEYVKRKNVFVLNKKDQRYLFHTKSEEELKSWELAVKKSISIMALKISSAQSMLYATPNIDRTQYLNTVQSPQKTLAHDAQAFQQEGKFAIKAVAIRDHIAERDEELPFLQGEVITVLDTRGQGVFYGRCEETEGIFYASDVVFQGRNAALVNDERPLKLTEQPKLVDSLQESPIKNFLSNKLSIGPSSESSSPVPQPSPVPSPSTHLPNSTSKTSLKKEAREEKKEKDREKDKEKEGKTKDKERDREKEKETSKELTVSTKDSSLKEKRSSKAVAQSPRQQVLSEIKKKKKKTLEKLTYFNNLSNFEKRYTKLDRVGKGSFGYVYKGRDEETGELVAIKTVDLEDAVEEIEMIHQEIAFMAQFDSPHVTKYYGSQVVGKELWIIMDYLGGGSVYDLLLVQPLEEKHIATILREVLKGLDYLHDQRKIHRDIKAANILLSSEGAVKLCDFGVAGQLSDSLTRKNTFIGTPSWMAPEVITNSGYDTRADIWSLGITAIELAQRTPPNSQMHPMRVLYVIAKEPPPLLTGSQYSQELKDFISRCLHKDYRERPTAKELLEHPFIKLNAESTKCLLEPIKKRQQWLLMNEDGDSSNDSNSHLDPDETFEL